MWSILVTEVKHKKSMARRRRDTEGKLNSFYSHMIEAKMWMVEKGKWETMDADVHQALM